MTFSGYLSDQEIRELRKAALNGGLLEVSRPLLLQGLPSAFVAGLPQTSNQLDQFALDLVHVNGVERMANGQIPVLIMLQNAADRLRLAERQEAEIFERLIDSIGSATRDATSVPSHTSEQGWQRPHPGQHQSRPR